MRESPDKESEDIVEKANAIYKQLREDGELNGHYGKLISIDTKYGFFGIGDAIEALRQIVAQIAWRRGKKEIFDTNWVRDRVYIRRIGKQDATRNAGEIPEREKIDRARRAIRGKTSKALETKKPPIIFDGGLNE